VAFSPPPAQGCLPDVIASMRAFFRHFFCAECTLFARPFVLPSQFTPSASPPSVLFASVPYSPFPLKAQGHCSPFRPEVIPWPPPLALSKHPFSGSDAMTFHLSAEVCPPIGLYAGRAFPPPPTVFRRSKVSFCGLSTTSLGGPLPTPGPPAQHGPLGG